MEYNERKERYFALFGRMITVLGGASVIYFFIILLANL